MHKAVIVDACRTPIGLHGGALSSVRPDDLLALVFKALVERTGVDPAVLDDVYAGCANQAGEDNRNVARMAVLLAGFPFEVPAVTVNRLCASSLDAASMAARAIRVGDASAVIAGGVESMSRAPYAVPKPERAFATGNRTAYDTTLGWRFENPRMADIIPLESMGETAENIYERWRIPRDEQDRFALWSHRKAVTAVDSGRFKAEIVPVEVVDRKGQVTVVDADEGPRRDTSLEKLARLKPAFRQGGTVTAGNSSSLNDGAAALLLMSSERAAELGLEPMARIVSSATAGVDPRVMGIGPVPATRKALDRAGIRLDDVGVIELNEAFAVQAIAVLQELGLDPFDDRVNPNGGAIALGHPLGCSGTRLLTTLVHELRRRPEVRFGLATMCVGVGQGVATVVERLG
ncbi:MAG: thiolase family protein [Bacillota bacterium]|nr:MAG: thiolase family protein [Bacillota bacterium]